MRFHLRNILTEIRDHIQRYEAEGRVVEKITLTKSEAAEVRREFRGLYPTRTDWDNSTPYKLFGVTVEVE